MIFTRFPIQFGGRYTRPLFPLRFTTFSMSSWPETSNRDSSEERFLRAMREKLRCGYFYLCSCGDMLIRAGDIGRG